MKLHRCFDLPPLYDLEVEIDADLHPTFAGTTFVITGMKLYGYDLYDHPISDHAEMFLRLAHIIQELAEKDDSILDELLEDAREVA